jgi:SpoVK/Ycf46/Vps4 family AAA+-type ATPase
MWIAASNRPDYIDAALVSRFDRILPFMLPGRQDRDKILREAMPRIVGLTWECGTDPTAWSKDVQDTWQQILDDTKEFSGREIEQVARRGLELACQASGKIVPVAPSFCLQALHDFKHSHDRRAYLIQTLLALRVTNFKDFLPDPEALPPRILKDEAGRIEIDWGKIDPTIDDLQQGGPID